MFCSYIGSLYLYYSYYRKHNVGDQSSIIMLMAFREVFFSLEVNNIIREVTLFIREILSFSFFESVHYWSSHSFPYCKDDASLLASNFVYRKHNSIVRDH